MEILRSTLALAVIALFALVLPACGGEGSSGGGGSEGVAVREGDPQPASPETPDQSEYAGGPVPSSGVAGGEDGESGGPLPASAGGAQESQTLPEDFDRKIVKSAELGLQAEDVRESAAEAQQIAARFGGSVLNSRVNEGGDSVSADLVLSIPSPEFEETLDELRDLGEKVTADAVRGEDVTEEFVDLQSRERNLLAAEQTLLELYDRAQDVNDALAIERELSNIRGQIEQVQGRIEYLENRTASSQVTLNIQPVAPPTTPPPAWSPAHVAAQAWYASLGVLQTIATAVISAVVFGWWLIPALIAAFVWWRRRIRSPTTTPPSP